MVLQMTKERAHDTSATISGCYASPEDAFSKFDTDSLMTKHFRILAQGVEHLTCISWCRVLQLQFSFPN